MPKPDAAHLQTDKELAKLEKRIAKIYKEAADDLQKTIDDYFAKFAKRDAKQKARLEAGEITEQEYKQWRLAQMGRGERFKALQSRVAERYTEANETAVRYVNDATPGIYSLNRNYSAYTIEKVAGNVGFDLWDEQTVKRLIVENPEVMPYYPPEKALKRGIDLAYGKKQISASVTSSILQGKSIPRIAKDLQTRMSEMNKSSAIRTARTAVTGAQNAGRMDSYVAAEKMGIKLRREWLAVIDNRTRHAHAMLDGQKAEMGKPFKVDGEEIMFPGDTSAPGYLVYNCRCSLGAVVDGVDDSTAKRRVKNPETGKYEVVSDMTYQEWAGLKEKAQVQKAVEKSKYNSKTIDHQYRETEAMNEYDYFSAEQEKFRLDSIMEMAGYDDIEAIKALDALCGTSAEYRGIGDNVPTGWFSGADTKIRLATDGEFFDKAKTIDAYIERSPKYKGSIYRGMSLDDETISGFTVGGTFKENGNLSSWTSDRSVASMFAEGRSEELGTKPVIFRTKDPKHGTPASHLSIFGSEESEVLVSNMKDSEYIIEAVTEESGIVIVDMILKGG